MRSDEDIICQWLIKPMRVYVVLLDPEVLNHNKFTARSPEYDPDLPCYYVGMTGLTPEERFENHKKGHKTNKYVKKYGIRLVPELYEHLPRFSTSEEAKEKEEELAIDLREEGHAAYWNGDDTVEEEPTMDSKEITLKKMDAAAEEAGDKLKRILAALTPEQNRERIKSLFGSKIITWLPDINGWEEF